MVAVLYCFVNSEVRPEEGRGDPAGLLPLAVLELCLGDSLQCFQLRPPTHQTCGGILSTYSVFCAWVGLSLSHTLTHVCMCVHVCVCRHTLIICESGEDPA